MGWWGGSENYGNEPRSGEFMEMGGGACGSGRVEEGDGAGRRRRPVFLFCTPRPTTLQKGLHQGLDVNSFEGALSFPSIVGGKPARHRQGQCQWAGCFDFLFVVSNKSNLIQGFPGIVGGKPAR